MSVGLIWAQARGGVIGADGRIPWHLPEDLAHFKARTIDQTVVMGRKTWCSLPDSFRPLPRRRNIVLTSQPDFEAEGAEVARSLREALDLAQGEVWVIGGGLVFAEALPVADVVVVTEIDLDVSGDTVAPALGETWVAAGDGDWQVSRNGMRYRIDEFRRP